MSACDNKLRSNLMEAMKLDEQNLEAEMQGVTPHVFSEVHERKIVKLLRRQKRNLKVRGVLRYAVAACLVLLLTGSILIISSEDLQASKLSVDIIEWLEEFFSTEKGTGGKKKQRDVLFEESQIEYMLQGLKKTTEFTNIGLVYFKYENDNGEFVQIMVARDKSSLQIDNKENSYDVLVNEAGYEYTGTYSAESKTGQVVWKDKNEIYYHISGTISYNEIVKIMNNISY